MTRPKSGTPKGDLATARWRKTMQMRYGDVTKKMQEVGRKGGLVKGTMGGFAHPTANPSAAGRKGGLKSKRTKKSQ